MGVGGLELAKIKQNKRKMASFSPEGFPIEQSLVHVRGLISPDEMTGESKLSTMSGEYRTSCWTFLYSEMSGENSKCAAKD